MVAAVEQAPAASGWLRWRGLGLAASERCWGWSCHCGTCGERDYPAGGCWSLASSSPVPHVKRNECAELTESHWYLTPSQPYISYQSERQDTESQTRGFGQNEVEKTYQPSGSFQGETQVIESHAKIQFTVYVTDHLMFEEDLDKMKLNELGRQFMQVHSEFLAVGEACTYTVKDILMATSDFKRDSSW